VIARILLVAAFLALIAALVQWRIVDREPPSEEPDVMRPGYFLTGVDLEEFGVDGRLRIGLQSISANEEPSTGVVRLSEVAVDYHAPAGRLWHLTSESARVPPGGRVIDFEGDVRLAGQPGEDPRSAQLYSERLSLDTVGEVADTKAPVELVFGNHRMHALGMRADLKAGTLLLESGVSGRFAP